MTKYKSKLETYRISQIKHGDGNVKYKTEYRSYSSSYYLLLLFLFGFDAVAFISTDPTLYNYKYALLGVSLFFSMYSFNPNLNWRIKKSLTLGIYETFDDAKSRIDELIASDEKEFRDKEAKKVIETKAL